MESKFAVSVGIWRIEQDLTTLEVRLYKYGEEVMLSNGGHILTWDELYDLLLRESYERRGEK